MRMHTEREVEVVGKEVASQELGFHFDAPVGVLAALRGD